MASRRGDTFDKRQRERRRQEKAAEKRAKRQGDLAAVGPRPNTRSAPKTTSEIEAMEKFRVLSEHHAAGGIDTETFEFMRDEIFSDLEIDPPR